MDTSYIAPKVDRALIKAELNSNHFLRKTNCGNKEIYVTTAHLSPQIMQEIGRLRELSFLLEGGGTGKPCDIDVYDILPEPYCFKQLFVWSPEDEEIVGGYRFIHGSNMMRLEDGTFMTPAASEFQYSEDFINNYLPYTVELGRAFVQPDFQPGNNLKKGLYSLDNLWDGLGSIALEIPETRYFFGKVTLYGRMNEQARDMVLYFMQKHFPDKDGLMWPHEAIEIKTDYNELHKLFCGKNYKEDYQILMHSVRDLGEFVPPLVTAYMNLSPTMRSFGLAKTIDFGDTMEAGIMVTLNDVAPEKRVRYVESYEEKNTELNRVHFFKINIERMPWFRNSRMSSEERETMLTLRQLKRQQRRQKRQERRAERRNGNKKS